VFGEKKNFYYFSLEESRLLGLGHGLVLGSGVAGIKLG
jgi:hypothetical protein